MPEEIFKYVYLACFLAGLVVRTVSMARVPNWWRKKDQTATDQGLLSEKLLMLPVFLGMQLLPILYLVTAWFDGADYGLPVQAGFTSGILGLFLFLPALWLLWRSHTDLGQNFAPELKLKQEHKLVTTGVFGHLRHPMYLAHWLWALAQALLLQNWIVGPAFLITFLPFYMLRVPREERMMLARFGDVYRDYMGRTGRMLPRLRK